MIASSSPSIALRAAVAAFAVALFFSSAAQAETPPSRMARSTWRPCCKPGPLPELSIGDAKGVPIVEYGSLTCPHCAVFDHESLPALKAAYIDTGKVRFIFREFSRNALDVAGFVLARCVGDDKALATIDLLFAEQETWAFVDNPLERVDRRHAPDRHEPRQGDGVPEGSGQGRRDARNRARRRCRRSRSTGTPTFVIDGKVYDGALSLGRISKRSSSRWSSAPFPREEA